MDMKKYSRNGLLGFVFTFCLLTPVWADDTEIFFGGTTNVSVRPNVLFVLDTSSSMNSTDGGSTTRLDRMKEALRSILNSAQDINVGLMRFSNPGGSIIYPIKYIDEEIEEEVVAATYSGTHTAQVSIDNDDAVEDSSGNVSLNDTVLSMMSVAAVSGSGSLSIPISHSSDDAEERVSNGSISLTSSDLEIMHENGSSSREQKIGLRFLNVEIPQGATIDSAYIEFEVDQYHSGSVKVDIWGEDTSDPSRYSSSNKITGRDKTSAKVDWDFSTAPSRNSSLDTSSLSSLVQEIVNRSDWTSGNAMAFILEDDGSNSSNYRELESYDGESNNAPTLHVSYSYSVPAETNSVVGLRFDGVTIPQGADITSATLSFVAGASSSSATSLTIKAQAADDSDDFSSDNSDLSGRSTTTNSVSWTSIPSWTEDQTYSISGLEGGKQS